MPAVAERLRRAYPAPLGRAGVGSIPANPDARSVPSFRRWRFEMKLSPFFLLRAHQSHFCLRVIAEDPGFRSDVSDIQTETEQICQAEQREWGNCPTCQRSPDGFCGNPGHHSPHAALCLPPTCAQYDDVPGKRNELDRWRRRSL